MCEILTIVFYASVLINIILLIGHLLIARRKVSRRVELIRRDDVTGTQFVDSAVEYSNCLDGLLRSSVRLLLSNRQDRTLPRDKCQ